MSVAFAKEDSAEAASETVLPARPISDRPNLVTEAGLAMLQAELASAQQALDTANLLEDINERRRQAAVPVRDVRAILPSVCGRPSSPLHQCPPTLLPLVTP